MKFGLAFSNIGPFADPDGIDQLARATEDNGFESVWTVEHIIWPTQYESEYPYAPGGKMPGDASTSMPDPLIWLSYLAAKTTTIRLGTGILLVPERNPLITAKAVATLDHLSSGRMELGIGVGWLREEFDALGVGWERRGRRTDEYLEAMRALWDSDDASYSGEFVSFSNVSSNPKPVNGRVPIVIGGHSPAAARRAGRLGDGFFPGRGTPAQVGDLIKLAHQTATEAGRDPGAIEVTASTEHLFGSDPAAAVEEMASLGVHRLIIPSYLLWGPDGVEASAAELAERLVAPHADNSV